MSSLLAAAIVVALVAAVPVTALATPPASLEVSITTGADSYPAAAPVPVAVSADFHGAAGRAVLRIDTTGSLSTPEGADEGAIRDGRYGWTLRFRMQAPGEARADITVQHLGDDGVVDASDTNSIFFLRDGDEVWVSTSSDVDVRLKHLKDRSGGAGCEDSVIGTVVGGSPCPPTAPNKD